MPAALKHESSPARSLGSAAPSSYPRNESVKNGPLISIYLLALRRHWRVPARILGLSLSCEIRCPVPERLFLPHPNGIVAGNHTRLANDVVLLQQVTLGCRNAYSGLPEEDGDP